MLFQVLSVFGRLVGLVGYCLDVFILVVCAVLHCTGP